MWQVSWHIKLQKHKSNISFQFFLSFSLRILCYFPWMVSFIFFVDLSLFLCFLAPFCFQFLSSSFVYMIRYKNVKIVTTRPGLPCSLKQNRVNNSLHLWSEDISLVEEWISLDSDSSKGKIHYSTSGISSGYTSIFNPKEVITEVTPQGVTSMTNRVKMHSIFFREYNYIWKQHTGYRSEDSYHISRYINLSSHQFIIKLKTLTQHRHEILLNPKQEISVLIFITQSYRLYQNSHIQYIDIMQL